MISPALNFSGPVTVVTGKQDTVFFQGNCYAGANGTSVLLDVVFPFSPFSTRVVPTTGAPFIPNLKCRKNIDLIWCERIGHALNVHLSAPATYAYVLEWAKASGF